MKFIRIVFFYVLYFFLCMIIVVTLMESLSAGTQMLFAFLTPGVWIWWREKRRTQKQSAIQSSEISNGSVGYEPKQRPSPTFAPKATPPSFDNNSIARTKEQKAAAQVLGHNESPVEKKRDAIREEWSSNDVTAHPETRWPKPVKPVSPKVSRRNQQGWVPKGESVMIAGREISGMVYVGTPPLLNHHGYRDKCRAYIDPSLRVAELGTDKVGNAMPYWPGYSDIPAQCRATYLDWLADGSSDSTYNPGYMFLYFYGLERRVFVDDPSINEKQEILNEVRRLAHLYHGNYSVQRYLGEFIQVAQVATTDVNDLEPVFDQIGWELPFTLKLAIGARLDKGENLNAEWVFSWLLNHPERNLRTPATRCSEEFNTLFRLRFNDRFPAGLKVSKPRKALTTRYQAASREFEGSLNPSLDGGPVSDISGLRKPVEIAQEIADEAMDDLDKFSRYLGRNPDGRGNLEAQALLPSELWPLFPSDELNALKTWAADIVKNGGITPVINVIARLEGAHPDKLSKRQLVGVADTLARIGFGFAPDPRFALRSPTLSEPVVIFDLGGAVEQLEDVSPIYRASLVELALGTFVAHADGNIVDAEHKSLLDQITQTEDLSEQERKRLIANLDWMLSVPPDMTLLRRKLKETGPDRQVALRAALVSAAHADGIIQSEEVAGIEKVYKALGLDPALVYSDLHAGDVQNGPVRVKAALPGETIPDEKAPGPQPLDTARIAAIRSDTERVSTVLGEIFAGDNEEEINDEIFTSSLKGLDRKHADLVHAIITQEHWSEEAFDELCKGSGLMSSGTLEAINEWAFENYDEALIDEYDGYDVAPEIAAELRTKFEKERQHVQIETT